MDTNDLVELIDANFKDLKTSKIPEDISDNIPQIIWDNIGFDVQKDINDIFFAYKHQKWTLAALGTFRLLESVLRIHLQFDYKKEEMANIGEAVKFLREKGYSAFTVGALDIFRSERNLYMHGHKRATL